MLHPPITSAVHSPSSIYFPMLSLVVSIDANVNKTHSCLSLILNRQCLLQRSRLNLGFSITSRRRFPKEPLPKAWGIFCGRSRISQQKKRVQLVENRNRKGVPAQYQTYRKQ